jgi:hypothetical protein
VIYEKIDTMIKSALTQVDQSVPTQNSQGVWHVIYKTHW